MERVGQHAQVQPTAGNLRGRGANVDLFGDARSQTTERRRTGTCVGCSDPVYSGELHTCPPKAAARATDPATSFAAARKVERSGAASAQRDTCLRAVLARPGLTAAEIADEADLERHVPSRRLPELRAAGRVRNGEQRECSVMGSTAMTWWPGPIQGER